MKKLFAVYLGGRAPGCNTELHDVVFAVGETIEATYEQLLDRWFGAPVGLHLDSWMKLDAVDGHRVSLSESEPVAGKKLYFVNLGGYADGAFTELHANVFLAANSALEAKARAKAALQGKLPSQLHTDDIYDVDDCLELGMIGGQHIVLEPSAAATAPVPVNGYHIIPDTIVREFLNRLAP